MCKEKEQKSKMIKKEKRLPDSMTQSLVKVFAMTDFPADIRVTKDGEGFIKAESEISSELNGAWDLLINIACEISLIQVLLTLYTQLNEKRN